MPDPSKAAIREVTRRWLHDAEFHAKVERAVSSVLGKRRGASHREHPLCTGHNNSEFHLKALSTSEHKTHWTWRENDHANDR